MVHGDKALASAERITQALFNGDLHALSQQDFEQLSQDGMDCAELCVHSVALLEALAASGVAPSKSAARKLVLSKGVRLNGQVQTDTERQLDWSDAFYGRYYLVRRGKKHWQMLVRKDA